MGRVYRAEDPVLGRAVALKIANDDSDIALMRFTGEAQAQARIDHPNVVKVFEVGEVQGTPFIVMQLIQGADLAMACTDLDLKQLVRIMQQVAEGAEAAHRLGLLHRDLKPRNILIEGLDTTEPNPFISDFGLVRALDNQGLTSTGVALGTPRYMSPEQAQGMIDKVDARSDVYSLGATMYEIFGGGPIYGEVSDLPLFRKIVEDDPPPLKQKAPKVPLDLAVIVHTCLAKDPALRYASAQALAEDLGRYLQGRPIWARRPSLEYRTRRFLGQHRAMAMVVGSGLSALLVLGALSVRSLSRSRRQTALASAFGQRAQRMETYLRLAYMSPEHVVRTQIDEVYREIERLKADIRQGGTLAEGPGNWALGEGYLALGATDDALRSLDAAWAAGFRTPESAFTRGKALVQKFIAAKNVLPGIEDEKVRAAELAKLEGKYKLPALDMMKQAQGLAGAGPLLAAQIAMLEERQDDALRESATALSAEPWRYEACILQSQIWKERWDRMRTAGDQTAAIRAHENVESAIKRALAIAPSSPEIWTNYGTEFMDRAGGPVTITIEKNTEDLMEQARTSYDRALALDPKWVVALNNRSQLAWRYALIGHMKGENPDAWIQRAVSDAKSSLAVDGEQPRAHLMLSQALLFKANVMVDQHREATRELDLGARSILRAKALVQQTGAFLGWNSFYSVEAQFSAMKGANAINHGGDGRPMFRDAVRSAQRALETDPDSMSAIGLATNITMQLADAEDRLGGDPLPILGEAQQGFDRLLKKFPGQVQVLRDCAEVHRIRASQLVRRNQDPGVELKETQRLLAEGLAQAPKFHELHQVKGRAALVQARWERHLGENEAASLTMARAELQKAKALNPRIADLDSDLHEILEFQANRSRNL